MCQICKCMSCALLVKSSMAQVLCGFVCLDEIVNILDKVLLNPGYVSENSPLVSAKVLSSFHANWSSVPCIHE